MIRLRQLLVEYVSVTDEKSKFHQPENFDKIIEEDNYIINAGANDWEFGYSGVTINFGGNLRESYTRIWIHPTLYGSDSGQHHSDADTNNVKKMADKFLKDLNKKAKAVHKIPNEYGSKKDWVDCFVTVLKNDEEIKKQVKEWGVDKTKWNDAKVTV
jgi:hypothetical protein